MSYTVDIITESLSDNIILVDGLTIEKLKIKYQWLFNAIIEKAIIGEDEYGLVWYMGDWICGEWYDGTWYSGTWYEGVWKNGKWYSWLLDKYEILSGGLLKKLDDDKKYSIFLNGTWENGYWYNGIFGDDINISGYTSKKFLNHTTTIDEYLNYNKLKVATWKNGFFYNGDFKNSIWENGIFSNGKMWGGYWKDGTFFNGTFSGNWWNGKFIGGDFEFGIWEDGIFNSSYSKSRFGYNSIDNDNTNTEWWNGSMTKSEVYSSSINPQYHNRTHWYNGTFKDGTWYGGHFFNGKFKDSVFKDGVFGCYNEDMYPELPVIDFFENVLDEISGDTSTMIFDNNEFKNGLWLNGTFKNGKFKNGIWLNGVLENGELSPENPDMPYIPPIKFSEVEKKISKKRSIL